MTHNESVEVDSREPHQEGCTYRRNGHFAVLHQFSREKPSADDTRENPGANKEPTIDQCCAAEGDHTDTVVCP